ncbi:MAG TPA: insulinase family protein [Thermoanaerobaculia bacterium]
MALLALALPLTAQVTSVNEIKTPPLRKLNMPQPKRVQLDNGMVILMMEDHELPLIRGGARIHGGGRDLPAGKAGLTEILGSAWRTGGTESKTGDQLDDFLEARAARVETGADDDSSSVRLDVLKDDFETVFPIFLDILRNPAFRQDKIDLARTQLTAGIARRNDDPEDILARELNRLGYGPASPYTAQPEYATLASITRDDLVAFHKRFVHPNNIVFAIGGDFDSVVMERKLRDAFASWPRGPQAPAAPQAMTAPKPGVYFVAKGDVTQANIGFVHPGIQRNNPDYFAVRVMNEIFSGGSFSGRLMNDLRTKRGLTYGVEGGLGANWDYPGLFEITMATKSGTTLESINALRSEVSALRTQPFTADELQQAKQSILNRFVFLNDSRQKVVNQAAILEFYGFPPDYFRNYPSNIEKVTAADVARVANKYVNPDQVAVLVVGNEKDFEKPLSSLGTVTPIDITIPELNATPATTPAAPAANNAEGTALFQKVRDFTGGKAKIDAINAVREVTSATRQTPQGPMDMEVDSITVFPDRHRAVMKMPMGEVTMVMTPESSFMLLPGMGTRDVPPSQRDAARSESRQELITILKNPDKYTFAVTGTEKIGNVDTKVLEVSSEGDTAKWYVDPATGKVLRKVGRGGQVTDFSSWGTFGGITVPTAFTMSVNGQQIGSGKVTSVEINPAIDPKVWEKPAS